jgi:hypothetical protein
MRNAKSVREVLIAARWILDKIGWTQGCDARDSDGRLVSPTNSRAVCFCATGAVIAVEAEEVGLRLNAIRSLERELTPPSHQVPGMRVTLAFWNDQRRRTKKQVLALFDRVIRKTKAGQ